MAGRFRETKVLIRDDDSIYTRNMVGFIKHNLKQIILSGNYLNIVKIPDEKLLAIKESGVPKLPAVIADGQVYTEQEDIKNIFLSRRKAKRKKSDWNEAIRDFQMGQAYGDEQEAKEDEARVEMNRALGDYNRRMLSGDVDMSHRGDLGDGEGMRGRRPAPRRDQAQYDMNHRGNAGGDGGGRRDPPPQRGGGGGGGRGGKRRPVTRSREDNLNVPDGFGFRDQNEDDLMMALLDKSGMDMS